MYNLKHKTYNSGLRALLSIRDADFVLEKHKARILKTTNQANEIGLKLMESLAGRCTADAQEKIQLALNDLNDTILPITTALNKAKEKIAEKNRADNQEFWSRFDVLLDDLGSAFTRLEAIGLELLPEDQHPGWKLSMDHFKVNLLPSIFSYAAACKVELQMIERYTKAELASISKIIAQNMPKGLDTDAEEAYEHDYLDALKDFKREFSEEKNLWDTFLDILAGGTHQPPSEHVMMERWIEGEKGNL